MSINSPELTASTHDWHIHAGPSSTFRPGNNMVMKAIPPKLIYRFNLIAIKIMAGIFVEIYKLILTFIWKYNGCNSQNNFENEEQSGGLTPSDFKSYHKTTIIKIMWWWHKDRHRNSGVAAQSPEISFYIYDELIFDIGIEATQWKKDGLFNNWYSDN